jgi:hypothetical protein
MRTPASRVFATLIALVFFATPALSATPAHFWSLHAGDTNEDRTMAVAVVPGSGDIVAIGDYSGPSTWVRAPCRVRHSATGTYGWRPSRNTAT